MILSVRRDEDQEGRELIGTREERREKKGREKSLAAAVCGRRSDADPFQGGKSGAHFLAATCSINGLTQLHLGPSMRQLSKGA